MKRHIVFAVFSLMFLVAPPYAGAEGPCEKCRNAGHQGLDKCIESAISREDKKSCMEKKEPRLKACEKGCARVVREMTMSGSSRAIRNPWRNRGLSLFSDDSAARVACRRGYHFCGSSCESGK